MCDAKNIRDGINHRRRYRCPICYQNTLWIRRNRGICERCNEIPEKLMYEVKSSDWEGYYTTADIDIKFQENKRTEIGSVCGNIKSSMYTKGQIEKMKLIVKKSARINDLLDDCTIYFFKKHPYKDTKDRMLEDYDYLFNIVEDIHVIMNWISKDFTLMDLAYQMALYDDERNLMFSPAYYYFNLAQHFYESIERFYICIGLMFKIQFQKNAKDNTRYYIEKMLKKNDSYRNSELKKKFQEIKSQKGYEELKRYREESSHNQSANLTKVITQRVNVNQDRFFVDKQMIQENLADVLKVINTEFELLEEVIKHLISYIDITLDSNAIAIIKSTGQINHLAISELVDISVILKNEYKRNEKRLFYINRRDGIIIGDIVFRLFEIIKGCNYALFFETNIKYEFMKYDLEIVTDMMDKQYLIYLSAVRTISSYDKIAHFLIEKYLPEYTGKEIYFNDFLRDQPINHKIMKTCQMIQRNPFYQFLDNYRNEITHIIRKGAIYTNVMEKYEGYLLVAICYNLEYLGDLLDSILDIR